MVYRVYVEKKAALANEARALLENLRAFLGIESLTGLRLFNRYDLEGISRELFDYTVKTVLSEPQLDTVTDALPQGDAVFAVEYLPGQYDQRADSAAQCVQILSQGERPLVRTARVYALEGKLTDAEIAAIKQYVINPVESREASLELPETLRMEYDIPTTVRTVEGFTAMDSAALDALRDELGLAMDLDDLTFLQRYFRDDERREPTITEIRVVDTYWSDHCRHTTFSTHIDNVEIDDPAIQAAYERYLAARVEVYGEEKAAKRPQTLMDIATIGAKTLKKRGLLPELDESEEINACSIHVTATVDGEAQDWLLMFKNETHNHPTEIEPFGGAATCIGGCIRDPLSGRAYVHQAMRVTGAGDPRVALDKTLPGKLPQRKLCQTAAAGYSSYGNQIGLATGHVAELYHEGYIAKRLECGAVVAAAPAYNVRRECPAPGDVVILLGGRTGRDGIGGATGSSKSHNLKSLATMASEVQKGNAPEERKIQRLFRNGDVTRLIKRCNDFGAGVLPSANWPTVCASIWMPCARSTTVSTARSLPSPNRRSAWPWSLPPGTQMPSSALPRRKTSRRIRWPSSPRTPAWSWSGTVRSSPTSAVPSSTPTVLSSTPVCAWRARIARRWHSPASAPCVRWPPASTAPPAAVSWSALTAPSARARS